MPQQGHASLTEFQADCENLRAAGIDCTPSARDNGFRISVTLKKEGKLFVHDDLEYDADGRLQENVWSNQDIVALVKRLRANAKSSAPQEMD